MLIALSGTMGLHMLVPALPQAGLALHATPGQMQLAVTVYVVGLAVGQLFYGPLSDVYGRRRVLLAGLAVFIAGSLVAMLAQDIVMMLLGRLVQALGSCAGLVIGRAIVRESTNGHATVSGLAALNVAISLSPGLAPMAGGMLVDQWGWRSIFLTLLCVGVLTFMLTWTLLREAALSGRRFSLGTALRDGRSLLASPRFTGFVLGCSGPVSIYAMVSASPFIFIGQFHQSAATAGACTGLMVMGACLGYAIMALASRRVPVARLAKTGMAMCIASLAILLALTALGALDVPRLVAGVMLFTCGTGLLYPVVLAGALGVRPELAGSAAGLFGFLQMGIGASCSFAVSFGSNPTLAALTVMSCATAVSLLGLMMAGKQPTAPS